MSTELCARVVLQEKVRFVGTASGHQEVVIDYPPPLGDDAGIRGGLELLLMALAACAGQTLVALLRRLRLDFDGCSVEARGTRRSEHPTLLTDIHIGFRLEGHAFDRAAVDHAVELAEQQFCPVWAMLKSGTRITHSVELTESGEAAET